MKNLNTLEKIMQAHKAFARGSGRSESELVFKCGNEVYICNKSIRLIYTIDTMFQASFKSMPLCCILDIRRSYDELETNFLNFVIEHLSLESFRDHVLYTTLKHIQKNFERRESERLAKERELAKQKALECTKSQEIEAKAKLESKLSISTNANINKKPKKTLRARLQTRGGKRRRDYRYFYKYTYTQEKKGDIQKATQTKPTTIAQDLFSFFGINKAS